MKQGFVRQIPLSRFASSEEMAEAIYFMASDKASYMTGQLLVIDGGSLIAPMLSALEK